MFLIDTDHLTFLQRRTQPEFARLQTRIAAHPPSAIYLSIISFHEQLLGWNAYIAQAADQRGVTRGYAMFQQLLKDFASAQVLPYDDRAAAVFESLRAQRVRIATMDLRVAASALSQGFTLLSRNSVDFGKVPRLHVGGEQNGTTLNSTANKTGRL